MVNGRRACRWGRGVRVEAALVDAPFDGPVRATSFCEAVAQCRRSSQVGVEVALWIDVSAETWIAVELSAAVGQWAGAAVLRTV